MGATSIALALGIGTVLAQVGLPASNLACSDGTNVNLALDPSSLLALSDAVWAINVFPAGDPALGCSLTEKSDPAGANGPKDFAVGGGRIFVGPRSFNFAASAHATSDAPPVIPQQGVGGTVNFTETASNGHLDTKVDCFVSPAPSQPTTPGSAQATAVVTKSTGFFASIFVVGGEVRWDFLDSGVPGSAPNGDAVNGFVTGRPCDFSEYAPYPIDHGNIKVKNDDF